MGDLLANNVGGGYCHAWFARRFLSPVKVTEVPSPHSALGIECYVQWTSPIRRFGDLQVHCAAKRYLRRQKVLEMLRTGTEIPSNLTRADLGCDLVDMEGGKALQDADNGLDTDIDYNDRSGFIKVARVLQRASERYWMLEYVRRLDSGETFDAMVLGCTNPTRRQYAIYVYELGLEWKYISPVGNLQSGFVISVKATNVFPHNGQMDFVRVQV
jgi:exoribonuclease R